MNYNFKVEQTTAALIDWIRVWFNHNGPTSNAILGISGGKDSTICAKLCVEALGKDRVIGIMLPNGEQHDKNVALDVCNYLGITYYDTNINEIFEAFKDSYLSTENILPVLTDQSLTNLAPRIRMTMLRFYAQNFNGRLINTSNLSEDWVGYATIDGDSAGDMSPLSMLTVQEVKTIGHYLGIPANFVEKIPEDGLVGKSDEDNLGVSYADIDAYIRHSAAISPASQELIERKFKFNSFKLEATKGMPKFIPSLEYLYDNITTEEKILIPGLTQDCRLNIW